MKALRVSKVLNLGNAGAEASVAQRFSSLWSMFKTKAPGVPPVDLIRRWQEQGNEFSKPILKVLLKELRLGGRFDEATKVLKWTVAEQPFELTSREYLMRIKQAGRERKLKVARKVYASAPVAMRSSELSTALLAAHAAQNESEKAEEILKTFTPTSAEAYNVMALMYLRMGLDRKAKEVLEKLNESADLEMDEASVYILSKYRERIGIELEQDEADRILMETIKEVRRRKDMFAAARNVMLAYGYMGSRDGVEEMWSVIEKSSGLPTECCAAAVEAFALVGDVEKGEAAADKVKGKQRRAKDFYPSLVWLYAKNGMLEKAEEVISEVKRRKLGITYASYDRIIAGYLERGQHDAAVEKLEEAYRTVKVNSRPDYETVLRMLPVFAEMRDVQRAETMVNVYKGWKDVRMFNLLLKVYVQANKPVHEFKARLNAAEVIPDEETKQLLAQVLKT